MAADPNQLAMPAALIAAIHTAFVAPVPRASELFAPGADDGDARDIRRALRGRRWTAVPRQVAITERSGINWFSPKARRHYLPLWLLASAFDSLVRVWTVAFFESVAARADRQAVEGPLYSPLERNVVVNFLRWVALADPSSANPVATALRWWPVG